MNLVEALGAVEVHLSYSRQQNLAVAEITVRALREQRLHELCFKAFGAFAEAAKRISRGTACLVRGEFRQNSKKELFLGLSDIYEVPSKEQVVYSSQGLALSEGWQNVNLLGRVSKILPGGIHLAVSSAGGNVFVPIALADVPLAKGEGLRVWGQYKDGMVQPMGVLPLGYKR